MASLIKLLVAVFAIVLLASGAECGRRKEERDEERRSRKNKNKNTDRNNNNNRRQNDDARDDDVNRKERKRSKTPRLSKKVLELQFRRIQNLTENNFAMFQLPPVSRDGILNLSAPSQRSYQAEQAGEAHGDHEGYASCPESVSDTPDHDPFRWPATIIEMKCECDKCHTRRGDFVMAEALAYGGVLTEEQGRCPQDHADEIRSVINLEDSIGTCQPIRRSIPVLRRARSSNDDPSMPLPVYEKDEQMVVVGCHCVLDDPMTNS